MPTGRRGTTTRPSPTPATAIRSRPVAGRISIATAAPPTARKEYGRAIADYDRAIRLDPNDARAHNSRAWIQATCPDAKFRDGKTAVESATKACELSGWKAPSHIDTLAAAYAEAGGFDAAVKWQSRAIELASDPKEKDDDRTRLELYRAKKPYRGAGGSGSDPVRSRSDAGDRVPGKNREPGLSPTSRILHASRTIQVKAIRPDFSPATAALRRPSAFGSRQPDVRRSSRLREGQAGHDVFDQGCGHKGHQQPRAPVCSWTNHRGGGELLIDAHRRG